MIRGLRNEIAVKFVFGREDLSTFHAIAGKNISGVAIVLNEKIRVINTALTIKRIFKSYIFVFYLNPTFLLHTLDEHF